MTILIGSIVLDAIEDRVTGVDIRVYRWIEQWSNSDEARSLVHSLSKRRLESLVIAYQSNIEAMQIWP